MCGSAHAETRYTHVGDPASTAPRPRVIVNQEIAEAPTVELAPEVWDELYQIGADIVRARVAPYQDRGRERQWPGTVWTTEIDDVVMAALAAERAMVEASKEQTTGPRDATIAALAWYQRVIHLASHKMAEIAREGRRARDAAEAPSDTEPT